MLFHSSQTQFSPRLFENRAVILSSLSTVREGKRTLTLEVCTMWHAEQLETRRLLAATAELGSHGVFKVTGTDDGETIEIALDAGGTNVQASVNGTVIGTAAVA